LEDSTPVLTSDLKCGKTYIISQEFEEIEVVILKEDQRFEIKARPGDMEAQIREALSLEESFKLMNTKGRLVPPSKLSQGREYRVKLNQDERHNCWVKWNDESIPVNTRDPTWEIQRLSLKTGKRMSFWKNDQKKAFCQLQPGETYELRADPGPQWQPRIWTTEPREPRFWIRLVINSAEHREGFKRSNMIRELPKVVSKLGGPIPYEIRDEGKKRIWINDMIAEGRYTIQAETNEMINIEIQGTSSPVKVIVGNGRKTAREIQKLSGLERPVMLVDEGGNRVAFSKVEAEGKYRVMINDNIWEQRDIC
jgi:hypothetical protein